MSTKIVSLLALAASATALDFSQWSPAGPNDSRGPCPGLNSLANHGIIPHSGQGLTVPVLKSTLKEAFNLAEDAGIVLAIGGLLTSPNPLGLSFDLSDLDKHNFIEHDASLSRADIGDEGGDDHTFRQDLFDGFMAAFDGMDNTTTEAAAKGRVARVQNETSSDPSYSLDPLHFVLGYAELALLLKGLGNDSDSVPIEWVRTFFEQEKIPYDQGWRTSTNEIGFVDINSYIPQLVAAGGDQIPNGLILSNTTLARAFLGLNVLDNSVSSITQTLLNIFGLGHLL